MSPKFSVDGLDLKKVGKGLLLALGGALIVALQSLAGAQIHFSLNGVDLSAFASLLEAALASSLINLIHKFLKDNGADPSEPIA